ncbi:MAG: efflux RND transporter periplasmic adaptor subunit [Methylobacter sp.]
MSPVLEALGWESAQAFFKEVANGWSAGFACKRKQSLHSCLSRSYATRENESLEVGRNKTIQARGGVACMNVVKERKLFRRIRKMFAGNASSRYRSNRLIPAYFKMRIKMKAPAWEFGSGRFSFLSREAGTSPSGFPSWSLGTRVIVRLIWLMVAFSTGCEDKNAYAPPPPPQVTVSQPIRQQVSEYLEFTGNTQAFNSVQLVARVQGYLEKVFFHDGDKVKMGQPLFLIQQDTYQARLKQAEAQVLQQKASLNHAQTELERFSGLVRQHAAAQTDVDNWRFERDNAKAAVVAAEANRDLAKLDLDYTRVVAPFNGRIDRRLKDPGNLVGAGEFTPLAQINQTDPIYVYFTINEADLLRVVKKTNIGPGEAEKMKIPAQLALSGEQGYPHAGYLDFTAISITPTTGTLLLRASYPNTDDTILPGLFARVRVLVVNSEKMALLVPETAIGYDQLGSYLLVVNDRNAVERRPVKLGVQTEDKRVIEEGISDQDWVIVTGLLHAIPGNTVNPVRKPLRKTDGASENRKPAP